MNRVLVMTFVVTVVVIAIWDIVRRNPQLFATIRPPAKRPPPRTAQKQTPSPPKTRGHVIELRRDPFQVLGVDRDVSAEELEAHVDRIRSENDPGKLEGMSAELRALAERRLAEVEAAYAELKGRQ